MNSRGASAFFVVSLSTNDSNDCRYVQRLRPTPVSPLESAGCW
jgi:hypothetical protein